MVGNRAIHAQLGSGSGSYRGNDEVGANGVGNRAGDGGAVAYIHGIVIGHRAGDGVAQFHGEQAIIGECAIHLQGIADVAGTRAADIQMTVGCYGDIAGDGESEAVG